MKRLIFMCAVLTALVANGVTFRGSALDGNCKVVPNVICIVYDAKTQEVLDTARTSKDGFFYVTVADDVDWTAIITARGYTTASFKKSEAPQLYEPDGASEWINKLGIKTNKVIPSYVFQLRPKPE